MLLDLTLKEFSWVVACVEKCEDELDPEMKYLVEKLHKYVSHEEWTPDKMAQEIMHERNKILDLFCKTFLATQSAPTVEALKDLFDLIELECTMGKDCLNQTFRIKLRGQNNETM